MGMFKKRYVEILSKRSGNYFFGGQLDGLYYERDTKTVFVYNLDPEVNELLLYVVFSNMCKILDVKIMKDKNSSKSKGISYVEVLDQNDVSNALTLTGKKLRGNHIMVKASEAEKNLAWEIQKTSNTTNKSFNFPPNLIDITEKNEQSFSFLMKNINIYLKENDLSRLLSNFGILKYLKIVNVNKENMSCDVSVTFQKKSSASISISKIKSILFMGDAWKIESNSD